MSDSQSAPERYVNCDNYRDVIETLSAGFYVTALDGTILDHNTEFARLLGFDEQENLVGQPVLDFWQDLKVDSLPIKCV